MDMWLFAYIFLGATAIELLLYFHNYFWNHTKTRQIISGIVLVSLGFTIGGLLLSDVNLLIGFIVVATAYRIVNLLRIVENRMNSSYLKSVTSQTGLTLITAQLTAYLILVIIENVYIETWVWLYLVILAQALIATVLLLSTIRRLNKTEFKAQQFNVSTSDLPTVTVAIPARNETNALEDSLHSILSSEYPKLEILVLDDCSQNKRTPEIIRSFAHNGVRFIKGKIPKNDWLAKNSAYAQLANEASGEIILFCGVDIKLSPDSIKTLINEAMVRKKRMVCIVPIRMKLKNNPEYSLTQAARYFWELAPPRRLFNRPPVFSSCWMIYKKDLKKYGGFEAVKRMVTPEAYFAKQAIQDDSYSMLRSSDKLGVYSDKNYQAQLLTAIRTRYPQLRRRPENVFFYGVFIVLGLIGPFALFYSGLNGYLSFTLTLIAGYSSLCLSVAYILISTTAKINKWYIAALTFLPMVIVDFLLIHISMAKYEFYKVIWKGRNICIPVMHVYSGLPNIK